VVEQYREREDKFDVDASWVVPDLTGVIPAGAMIKQRTVSLSSRYLDTAALDLLRHEVTLRLRTGDMDAGWQLKVPDGAARTELRAPADGNGRAVPPQLREVIFGISGGAALRPVATLDTARTITRIVDSAGEVLVEIDDDQVSATRPGADAPSTSGARSRSNSAAGTSTCSPRSVSGLSAPARSPRPAAPSWRASSVRTPDRRHSGRPELAPSVTWSLTTWAPSTRR
jgi:hypothetical protein